MATTLVRDTGIAIAAADRRRIVEPFVRLTTDGAGPSGGSASGCRWPGG